MYHRQVQVGFVMASTAYLRNFEPGIAALLGRGHRVTLVVEHRNALAPIIQRLSAHPGFGIRVVPVVQSRWDALGSRLRRARDYWRYLDPLYATMPVIKGRAEALVPSPFRLDHVSPRLRSAISQLAGAVERRL